MIETVAVIGAGTMGNGIAHVFAQNGFNVRLVDVKKEQLDKAIVTISKNMERQITKGSITESDRQTALQRIQVCTDLREGVSEASLAIEAATEEVSLKQHLFKMMDDAAP